MRLSSCLLSVFAAACGRVAFDPLAADARPVDGVVPLDAAGTEITVPNPGCEDGATNWSGFDGVLSTSTTAHSGSLSCQVCCAAGGNPYCTLDDTMNPVATPTLGDIYYVEAWVRAVPGGSTSRTAVAKLREWAIDNVVQGDVIEGDTQPLSDTSWVFVSATKTVVGTASATLDLFIHHNAPDTECFLIDDIRLVRLP